MWDIYLYKRHKNFFFLKVINSNLMGHGEVPGDEGLPM